MRPRMWDVSIRCSRRSTVVSACGAISSRRRRYPGQRMRFAFHGVGAEVLEQVIVRVHAVERGVGRMGFAQVAEQVVDEMREGFGCNH